MKRLALAVLISLPLLAGCDKGPSCDELAQQIQKAQLDVMSAGITADITGDTTKGQVAQAKLDALVQQSVEENCPTNPTSPFGGS